MSLSDSRSLGGYSCVGAWSKAKTVEKLLKAVRLTVPTAVDYARK